MCTTDRFRRVLNVAAHVISGTRKFDRGPMQFRHSELHSLDVPERIQYTRKLGLTIHWCL